jgi:CRP/FNR family transcriptional regulator
LIEPGLTLGDTPPLLLEPPDVAGGPETPVSTPAAAEVAKTEAKTAAVDPLFLFYCGLQWMRKTDANAGWELIRNLHDPSAGTRAVAGSLLARARNSGIVMREPRRRGEKRVASLLAVGDRNRESCGSFRREKREARMNTPYGLELIDSCMTCPLSKEKWFCNLSRAAKRPLASNSHLSSYPSGAVLFVEGQAPRGVYVLCSGRAKLSTTSREGKVLILKIAEAGEAIGLSAAVAGDAYQLTAETATPCLVNFLERTALIRMIEQNGEVGLHATQLLSREFQAAYRDIHDLVLARSSAGKLARLLVSWMPNRERLGEAAEVRIRANATHEEMAQMIGSSRETVTRLLSDLKRKELIRLEGSTMVIRDRSALEAMAN